MRIVACIVLGAALAWAERASAAEPPVEAAVPATAPPEQAPPEPPAPGELARTLPAPKSVPHVEIHGGAYFWYYQPLTKIVGATPDDGSLNLYLASLEFEGRLDDFGLLINPRFRDSKARDFFFSNVWMEQVYAFWDRKQFILKAGKIYDQFSRLSDDTFYASIPYFDGLKLAPDYGLSFEGSVEAASGPGIGYYAQYFLMDGHTNGSLTDRELAWIPGAKRRNIGVLRLEPSYRFTPTTSLRLGLAGQFFQVDLGSGPLDKVLRLGGDLSFAAGPVKVFGEFIAQFGKTARDYPIAPIAPTMTRPGSPGKASGHNFYGLAGAEVQLWRLMPRYSFSLVRYGDLGVTEMLHIPGVSVTLHENVSFMIEYAYWPRHDPKTSSILDNSLNTILYAHF